MTTVMAFISYHVLALRLSDGHYVIQRLAITTAMTVTPVPCHCNNRRGCYTVPRTTVTTVVVVTPFHVPQ